MSVPHFRLGAIEPAYQHNLKVLAERRAVSRLWQKDVSLWPTYEGRKNSGSQVLNWLDLPGQLEPAVTRVIQLAAKLTNRGIQDIVFLALSSSSLAAELIPALGLPTRGVRFHAVSSLEPLGLRALESRLDFTRTLFLVASKSGKNLEMHALLLHFLAKVKATGIPLPGSFFVAITEDGSYLATLATENLFQAVLTEPHGFRGRFSGLQHHGLLLAGLCELDLQEVLNNIRTVQLDCTRTESLEQNPAATLAAFLAALTQCGIHRVVFRAPARFDALLRVLGHVVGSSSCKGGKGLLPFLEYQLADQKVLNESFGVCDLLWNGESHPSPLPSNVPSASFELNGLESIPAETFYWGIAASLACSLLSVNPFEDPDYIDGRDSAMKYVEELAQHKKWDKSRPRIVEGSLSLFVEGDLRHDVSSINLETALASFLALCATDSYCVFLNFLWDTPETTQRLTSLLTQLTLELGVPAQLASGPRYLHLLGQCYKGGPRGGVALMLTAESTERSDVPGADYSLADLRMALALGDMDAMVARGRPIVRLHLAGPPEASLAELEAVLLKALKSHRRTH